jgi:uncharacterized protein
MEAITNAINWFEIPVKDFDRSHAFYSRIFDYEMPIWEMGPTKMGILPSDMENGGVGGGITNEEGTKPNTDGVRIYLNGGKDLNVVLNRVDDAGGSLVVPKTKVTDEIGFIAIFQDSEGNHIGLHSPE